MLELNFDERRDARGVLEAAKDLLSGRWCTDAEAKNVDGKEVAVTNKNAVQFDLVGSVLHSAIELGVNAAPAVALLHQAIVLMFKWVDADVDDWDIQVAHLREWNDAVPLQLEEVLIVIDRALMFLNEV